MEVVGILGHQLKVYRKRGWKWQLSYSANTILSDYLSKNPPQNKTNDSTQKFNAYGRHITKFTWSSPVKDAETNQSRSFIIVVNAYGKIYAIEDNSARDSGDVCVKLLDVDCDPARDVDCDPLRDVDCDSRTVSSVCWVESSGDSSHMLALGYTSGRCDLVILNSGLEKVGNLCVDRTKDLCAVEHIKQTSVSTLSIKLLLMGFKAVSRQGTVGLEKLTIL